MRQKSNMLKIFLFISMLLFFFSCSHKKDIKTSSPEYQIKKPAKVLILPFKKITQANERKLTCNVINKKVVCSYSDEQFKLIGRKLADDFYYALKEKREDYKPISIDTVENAFNRPFKFIKLQDIVRRFNIDYLIEGYIYKFIEREGSAYSVKRPATVHFVVGIRDAITGEVVWQKEYYEEQKDLSQNILNIVNFFKRKAKWLTALELAEYELNKIVSEMP
jgi:hypothetical protein